MSPVRRRLVALVLAPATAVSLLAPGAPASPPAVTTGTVAPASSSGDILVPEGHLPDAGEYAEAAFRALADVAGKLLGGYARSVVRKRKAVPGGGGNASISFFDLSLIRDAEGIPAWLRKSEDYLYAALRLAAGNPGNVSEPGLPAASLLRAGTPEHEDAEELYARIGATPDSRIVQISTASISERLHSEIAANEWFELILRAAVKGIAKKHGVKLAGGGGTAGDEAAELARRIRRSSSLFLASLRSSCGDCTRETRYFRSFLAFAFYGTTRNQRELAAVHVKEILERVFVGLDMMKAMKIPEGGGVSQEEWSAFRDGFAKKLEKNYGSGGKQQEETRRESPSQEEERRRNLGLGACPPPGTAGYGGAGGGPVMAMA
ncbi:hypothetical protein ACFQ08_34060, partial [Streptosporangium algeriense]